MMTGKRITRRRFLGHTAGLVAGGTALGEAGLDGAAAPSAAEAPVDRSGRTASESAWQIGCYTRPFDQHDYLTALDGIATAGFRYVGLMTTRGRNNLVLSVATPAEEAQQVGDAVRQRGLKCVSVYGGDFPVGVSLEAGVQGLRQLIDHCAAVGGTNLMLGGTADERLFDRYYQAIASCCGHAREKGVGLSIKPHGGLNSTGPQCRKILERVAQPNFRLWYDPGNIYYYSEGALDPVDDVASVDGLVVGVSVKDYRHPKEVMVTPGTGRVDFPGVFRRLKEGGFTRGPLVVECLERGDLKQTIAEARKAREFLEQLTGQKA